MWIMHWANAQSRNDANSQGQVTRANTEHTSPYSEMPLCLSVSVSVSVFLSFCLSVFLSGSVSSVFSVFLSFCLPVFLSSVSLSVCLSVCLSVSLSLNVCLFVCIFVCQVCPCIGQSGMWREVPTRSPSPSDLSSQTLPLVTSLFTPPSVRCKRHG